MVFSDSMVFWSLIPMVRFVPGEAYLLDNWAHFVHNFKHIGEHIFYVHKKPR